MALRQSSDLPTTVTTTCRATGEKIPMVFRPRGDELARLGQAIEAGLEQISVERYCPFCMERHAFELPIPQAKPPSIPDEPSPDLWAGAAEERIRSSTLRDIRTTPLGDLHREYWKAERLARSSRQEELRESLSILERITRRYEDRGDERTVAACKVLKGQALIGLGRSEESGALFEEALAVLDVELDQDMIERARSLQRQSAAA